MPATTPVLEDFDWRTSVVVSTSSLENLPQPIPICRLSLRTTDDHVTTMELTAEQLDAAIEALSSVERKLGQQIAAAAVPADV